MRRLRHLFNTLLVLSDSPKRIATSYSAGILLGFSPLLGLHTILGVAIAHVFRLNKPAVLLGVWSNLPWIFVPYYATATWLGMKILGTPGIHPPEIGLQELMAREFWIWLADQWHLLVPAFVGSGILCLLLAVVAYPVVLMALRTYERRAPLQDPDPPPQAGTLSDDSDNM